MIAQSVTLDEMVRPATFATSDSFPSRHGQSCSRFVHVWLVLRTLVWTALAVLQPNPPLDTVEWLTWGRVWSLGYHKHPPLGAWLGEIGCWLTPGSFAGAYFVGYLAVALALWSVWQLGRTLLSPRLALAATLCLDGLIFLGPTSAEYNNAVMQIGFWALSIWLFYRAFEQDRLLDWMLAGLATGLGMLSKYTSILLVACLFGYWIVCARRNWRGPILSALVTTAICLPHLFWLIENDFPTYRWVSMRGRGESGSLNHHWAGLGFLASQSLRLVPVIGILVPLLRWGLRAQGPTLGNPSRRARWFLLVAVMGPVLLHVGASLAAGMALRDGWGLPLWTFFGLMLLCLIRNDESDRAWKRFLSTWAVVSSAMFVGFVWINLIGIRPLRIHFPGRALADTVNARFAEQTGKLPGVIAGDFWLAGNIVLHSAHRPTLFGSLEPSTDGWRNRSISQVPSRFYLPDSITSPWTNDNDMRQRGAVLVWDAERFGDELPPELRTRFPDAQVQSPVELPYQGGHEGTIRTGWALLRRNAAVQ